MRMLPGTPLRLARRRTWGQILAASAGMYVSRPMLFLGLGLLLVPVTLSMEYWLFVERPGGSAGAHDFYFYTHDVEGSGAVEAADVQDFARRSLRGSKTPEVVTFVEALPYTETGKLLRRVVQADLQTTG